MHKSGKNTWNGFSGSKSNNTHIHTHLPSLSIYITHTHTHTHHILYHTLSLTLTHTHTRIQSINWPFYSWVVQEPKVLSIWSIKISLNLEYYTKSFDWHLKSVSVIYMNFYRLNWPQMNCYYYNYYCSNLNLKKSKN